MTRSELKRRLGGFGAQQRVERFTISESAPDHFQIELTLKPNTPVTEQFILRLESALRQELGSLSLFRIRNNVLFVRFTLRRTYDEDSAEADRIEESPSLYLGSGQSRGFSAREMVVA